MTTQAKAPLEQRAEAMRSFNRFYTRRIGVLHEKLLRSPFSLTEVRVLYELAQRNGHDPTAAGIARELGLDAGYLSRILLSFEKRGFLDKRPSQNDRRQHQLSLTEKGRNAFDPLDSAAQNEVAAVLNNLSEAEQSRLIGSMHTIERLLGSESGQKVSYLLRPHQPGDIGWVIHSHGVLYAQEYGWNEQFEAVVAEIAAKFLREFDPRRERCWIAERDGENVGSVFLIQESDEVAKLRLLIVDPKARGLGIGSRLVGECLRFARQAGYRKVTLWTDSILLTARRIYERAGFRMVQQKPHHSFGHDLLGEVWEFILPESPA